ncbi:MAG TPA: YigZ family protein [Bacteroidales bacterium]|jgi:uncharacterized YigZ family protein|nr:YigZ family protein [Bacteroidales bacterium]MBP7875145.1 YigZ family protein [Bacteroidales bacterium]MCZ2282880.1 YigZ family protein [Bacteroidales bacterium]NLH33714.1 YigZ family protein [Lentimicrobium sp.]HPX33494.1 YigZ family protein [Bacteroidales bacterium]
MLSDDTYKTVTKRSQGLYKDKGSRFISFAIPVKSEEEIRTELELLRNQYHDARHQCYAWILGYNKETYRYNDDGEPSGTAGKPIYGQLLSNDLTNTVIVVIRYFGGIKLGVRGLINAYKFAAQDALANNVIQTRIIHDIYQVKFAYEHMNHVMRILKEEELDQIDQDFHLTCSIDFSVRSSRADYVVTRFNDLRMVELTFLRRE